MKQMHLKSRAKINLSLDVLGKRDDGYYEIETVMQQINLYDNICVSRRDDSQIKIATNCEYIPVNASNTAYRAADRLREVAGISEGVDIYIDKEIPVSAGLAGGSTNAAAVLEGLNKLWDLNLSRNELMVIGEDIGADVPFCILGGTALAKGKGEKLTIIQSAIRNIWIILVKPPISVSTGDVYRQLNLSKITTRPNTPDLIDAIEKGNIYGMLNNMENVLESVTETKYPVITEIKRKMIEYNCLGSKMSGSGPTVFGICKNYKRAKATYRHLSLLYRQVYVVQTYNGGK
ncbi:MAG TPA: 4-(cytidine 5'-diphospho)-2-C-methyl-D-erythritol kinase [Clostridia bacterium]|nr:4-(cytidine 5'-diphospho)-2-C-methyl-D-erythritol kinase [Clostridia bacterium]